MFWLRRLKHRGTEVTEAEVASLLRDLCASLFFLFAARHHSARGPKNQLVPHLTQVPQSFYGTS